MSIRMSYNSKKIGKFYSAGDFLLYKIPMNCKSYDTFRITDEFLRKKGRNLVDFKECDITIKIVEDQDHPTSVNDGKTVVAKLTNEDKAAGVVVTINTRDKNKDVHINKHQLQELWNDKILQNEGCLGEISENECCKDVRVFEYNNNFTLPREEWTTTTKYFGMGDDCSVERPWLLSGTQQELFKRFRGIVTLMVQQSNGLNECLERTFTTGAEDHKRRSRFSNYLLEKAKRNWTSFINGIKNEEEFKKYLAWLFSGNKSSDVGTKMFENEELKQFISDLKKEWNKAPNSELPEGTSDISQDRGEVKELDGGRRRKTRRNQRKTRRQQQGQRRGSRRQQKRGQRRGSKHQQKRGGRGTRRQRK